MPLRPALFLRAQRALEARRDTADVETAERRLVAEVDEPPDLTPGLLDRADRLVGRKAQTHLEPIRIELLRIQHDVEARND